MTDDMIPSEATMAGCVAQSIDGYVECTCPNDAGICIDCMTNEIENLRRQLAQAQERADEWHSAWQKAMVREIRLRFAIRATADQLRRIARLAGCDYEADIADDCGESNCLGHVAYRAATAMDLARTSSDNPYEAVVEASLHDYSSARMACEYRRGAGGCEAWIKRGRTCPDCPLESFDALSGALAAIDDDTIATCANGTRLEALGGGADSGTTKHTSDDPPPPHRTHTDAPGVSEGGGLDPGSQGAANRTAGEGSDSA